MQLKKEFKTIIIIYIIAWILFFVGIVSLIYSRSNLSFFGSINRFYELLDYANFLKSIHVFFVTVYILFFIVRYFLRIYKKRGFHILLKQFGFRIITPILVLAFVYKLIVYTNNNEDYQYQWDYLVENTSRVSKNLFSIDKKHRGMHVFDFRSDYENGIKDLIKTNTEWAAIVPFFYQKNEKSKEMSIPDSLGIWTKRDSSFIKVINLFHKKGVRIFLKPHLWLSDGWRSNINYTDNKDWDIWFQSYKKNILHYAKLAEATKVELLCIGTELRTSVKNQPQKWLTLIKEIRKIYSGKLTYAANWDDKNESYEFWRDLDYIGIQAYFPLTNIKNPDLETIKSGWKPHIEKLEKLSKKFQKPILFTEIGYKSEASSTIHPWEWDSFFSNIFLKKSDKTQQLAYEALFEELWDKDWFTGMYIWQWSFRSEKENASINLDFSPRFKPAENTITKWFGK